MSFQENSGDSSKGQFQVVSLADNHKAVVILFGWLGANTHHVNKYAQLYNERGCSTVVGVADTVAIMTSNKAELRAFALDSAQRAAALLRQGDVSKKLPLYVHVFSNGGAFALEQLELAIQEKVNDSVILCGEHHLRGAQLFDSAPAYLFPSAGLKAIATAVPNLALRFLIHSVFVVYLAFNAIVATLTRQPVRPDEFWSHMRNTAGVASRQVYLYSPHDDITDHVKLEELIAHRKNMGVDVTVETFPKSGHVQHLRNYPEEYARTINTVLSSGPSRK